VGAEVRVLGPLQVFDGAREVPVGGARERTLLAALAVRPDDGLSADQLVDALWRERPPRSAAKQLQNHVLRVRKALGTDAIRTTQAGYALGDDIDVDAVRFESCVREARTAAARGDQPESVTLFADALAMWRGRSFAELDGWDGATAEAVRLEELRRSAEEEAIDARLTLGAATESVVDAEALVAAEPLREHRWVQLMRALYRCGRQADALRAYQRARETLARELGIEPGSELRATEQAVLAQDDALVAQAAMPPDVAVGLPSGVVTFLLTDIEESARLWADHADGMASAVARHDEIVAAAVAAAGGTRLKSRGEGDGTLSVFTRATDGIVGALGVRDGLEKADWPPGVRLSVRCALHTGEAVERDGDYFGPTLNRAARLRALAVGSQVLVSQATAELTRDQLPDGSDLVELGPFELRDLERPERIFALVEPGKPGRDVAGGVCPYQGLLAFQPEDRDRFFGRDELVKTLLTRLLDTRHVAVVAASGSGKSSVVRAGIAASLPAGSAVLFTPGPRPLDELAARLAARGGTSALGLRRELVQRPRSALTATGASAADRLTLVVDQLEELFTLGADEAERHAFLDVLVEAGTDPGAVTAVVVALRGDFYGHCGEHPAFAAMISSATVLLGQMRPEELRAAIEGPARRAGLRVEPGLVDLVLDDVAHEPGALPLMSHALRETWRRRDGHTLSVVGYRAAGGVRGAIAHSAETLYGSLAPAQQAIVRSIFVRLTEPGSGADDTGRKAPRRELVGDDPDPAAVEVLELLADSRLVTIGEDGAEVAHEALIREWPRLRGWLDEDRDGLRVLRGVARAADEWVALDRDPGALYRGARLASVLEWQAAAPATALTPLERGFVESSRALQEAETEAADARFREQTRANRRLRRLLAGIGLALVIAVTAGVIALVQRNRADDEASAARDATRHEAVGRLVAESGVVSDRDPYLATLLALEANRLADTPSTRGALLDVLVPEPRLQATMSAGHRGYSGMSYVPPGRLIVTRNARALDFFDTRTGRQSGRSIRLGSGNGLAVSPDGSLVATGSQRGTVSFWDVATRQRTGPALTLRQQRGPFLAFSPDGRQLVTATGNFADPGPAAGSVQVWDVATRQPIELPLTGDTAAVARAAFSPDGRILATGGGAGTVVLHDAHTGATLAPPLATGANYVSNLAFSPDGSRVGLGTQPGRSLIFDVATGTQLASLPAPEGNVSHLIFSPDGRRIATLGAQDARVWDAATFEPIGTPMHPHVGPLDGAFSPDGRLLAIVGQRQPGIIGLWDPDDAYPRIAEPIPGSPPLGGVYSPDGKVLAVADLQHPTSAASATVEGDRVTLYRTKTRNPLDTLPIPTGPSIGVPTTAQIAFSPDSRVLAISGLDNTIRRYEVSTLQPLGDPIPVDAPPTSLAFSPDGKLLAAASSQTTVTLIDTATGTPGPPYPLDGTGFAWATFSPDGRRLVASAVALNGAVVFDLTKDPPTRRHVPGALGEFEAGAFSPDGRVFVTGDTTGNVQFRDGRTFAPRGAPVASSTGAAWHVVFSPDSTLVAVTHIDQPNLPTRLIDARTHQPIGDPINGVYFTVSFSPDSTTMAAPGPAAQPAGPPPTPGHTVLWKLDLATWRKRACEIAGRNLTASEARHYLPSDAASRPTCARFER
jgi:WD40 repeat protein/DNA-binding SARP family transcriptional activator